MRDKKTKFRVYTIAEWQKEQEYLRRQHKNGWKFVKVNFIGMYHFEKCRPEDVVYQIDYNLEGLSHRDEYIQLFQDCGWEYIQDLWGYSYFRKPASEMNGEEEEIFCDDSSRLDMIKRVFQGRMIPLFTVFFLLILPNLYIQSHLGDNHILTFLYIGLFVLYVVVFVWFGYQFWRYKRSLRS